VTFVHVHVHVSYYSMRASIKALKPTNPVIKNMLPDSEPCNAPGEAADLDEEAEAEAEPAAAVLVEEPVAAAPPKVVPLVYIGSATFPYASQVAFGDSGQSEAWQIAWRAAGAAAGTDAGGAQRIPKVVWRAMPTAVTSSVVTPKEAAAVPTWVIK